MEVGVERPVPGNARCLGGRGTEDGQQHQQRLLDPRWQRDLLDVDRALVYAVFAGPEPDVFYGGGRGATEDPYLNSVVVDTGNTTLMWMSVPTNSERSDSANAACAALVAL